MLPRSCNTAIRHGPAHSVPHILRLVRWMRPTRSKGTATSVSGTGSPPLHPADPMTGLPAPRRFALPAAAAWPLARSDRPAIPGPFHDAANTSPVPPRHSGPQKKPRVKHPRLLACRQPAGIRRPARWSGSASCSAPHRSRGSGWPAESRLRSRRCRQRPAATPATDRPPP